MHSRLAGIALPVTLRALPFLHLLVFLYQYTARTAPRAKAVTACIAIDTISVAYTAASGTLQERLKTAACESAITKALDEKELEVMLFKWVCIPGRGFYTAITHGGIWVPCFALLGSAIEDAWTP